MIIRICTPSYTCAICFLPLYSARYNGKSVSSTASKPDWFISAFADWWHGVGLNLLVLPSESLCPFHSDIRTVSGPPALYRRPAYSLQNTIYCTSFLIIAQYNVFVNQFMRKNTRYFLKRAPEYLHLVPFKLLDILSKEAPRIRDIVISIFTSHCVSTKEI